MQPHVISSHATETNPLLNHKLSRGQVGPLRLSSIIADVYRYHPVVCDIFKIQDWLRNPPHSVLIGTRCPRSE
ncbi:hypothetical protein V2G26_006905 [Clonostachys chloroleuca]